MSLLSQFFSSGVSKQTIPIEIFAVGGGGGGGGGSAPGQYGAGGGAGQVLYQQLRVNVGVAYTITIGSGGAGGVNGPAPARTGNAGSNTTFGSIICYGGGGGGGAVQGPTTAFGSTGGVGEGYLGGYPTSNDYYISSKFPNTPNMSVGVSGFRLQAEGTPGYSGSLLPTASRGASGGGGAQYYPKSLQDQAPVNFDYRVLAAGQDGIPAEYIGISTFIVGGGGAGGCPSPGPLFSIPYYKAGFGGGGGVNAVGAGPQNGDASTGGGGAGAGNRDPLAGSGGSGGLVIRYPTGYAAATAIGNTTSVPSQPGFYVYRWTSGPGSITFN